MDCNTARLLAEVSGRRESELPPEDAVDLDRHLESCPECRRLRFVEEKFDIPIARAMRAVVVPPGLKARIFDQLATQRGALHRRRFFYVAAAAACIVAAIGVLTWQLPQKEKLGVNELVRIKPLYVEDHPSIARDWLTLEGIAYQPPVEFEPKLLTFCGMTSLQNKQVPTLVYRAADEHGAVYAQVYIIRESDFDLSSLPATFSGSAADGSSIEIYRDPGAKQAYVVLFTGNSLKPFQPKRQAA